MGQLMQRAVFQPPEAHLVPVVMDKSYAVKSSRGSYNIPIIHIKTPGAQWVLVYSHGNSEDLSLIFDWCQKLAFGLNCDVVAYEYCGYGMHVLNHDRTTPSEQNVFNDVMDVVTYARSTSATHQLVVVYGRSLGSAPSIYAASHHQHVDGLIVESGFLTCAKTVMNTGWTLPFDMFRNEDFVKECRQSALVIHGTHDHVVPFTHGVSLHSRLPNAFGDLVRIENGQHNDLDSIHSQEVIASIQFYLLELLRSHRVSSFSTILGRV